MSLMPKTKDDFYGFILGLFISVLLISNTIEIKTVQIGSLTGSVGLFLFPLSYVLCLLLTDVYGKNVAKKAVITGILSLLLMSVCYEVARTIPPADFWTDQTCFDAIFTQTLRYTIALLVACATGHFVSIYIFAMNKMFGHERSLPVRLVSACAAGFMCDTLLLALIAFLGILPVTKLMSLVLIGWGARMIWVLLSLPLSLPLFRFLKKIGNAPSKREG